MVWFMHFPSTLSSISLCYNILGPPGLKMFYVHDTIEVSFENVRFAADNVSLACMVTAILYQINL